MALLVPAELGAWGLQPNMVVRSSGPAILLEELSEFLSQELRLDLVPVRLLDPTGSIARLHRAQEEEDSAVDVIHLLESDHVSAVMVLLQDEKMTTKICRRHGEQERSALKSK